MEDCTDEKILETDAGKRDVLEKFGSRLADLKKDKGKSAGAKKRDRGGGDEIGALAAIRANASLLEADDDQPVKKKMKMSKIDQKLAQSYQKFCHLKISELQDILRWNMAPTGGKKDALLIRVIDGDSRGRLPKCPSCIKGRLKVNEEGTKVVCPGFYNEESGGYEKCFMEMDLDNFERLKWFNEKPTEEEEEAMENEGGEESSSSADLPDKLLKSLESIEWDPDDASKDRKFIKDTTMAIAKIITAEDSPLAISDSAATKVKMTVGPILLQNKDKTMREILDLIIEKYGLKEAKEKASKAKANVTASLCRVRANGGIFDVINELASAYSKESNTNAANTYRKVAQAVKNLDFEITVDNAKGLGGGKKTKVPGIGKKSAEYMLEFLTTGQIGKLEEKKAAFE